MRELKLQFRGRFSSLAPCRNLSIDRFSLEINFKRARNCHYGIPKVVQVKMKILYTSGMTTLQRSREILQPV